MSPEQQAEKQYPIGYHPPGNFTVGANLRAAFLSGVSWQKENGWLAYPENKPEYGEDYLIMGAVRSFGWYSGEYKQWFDEVEKNYVKNITHFAKILPEPKK